MKRIIVMVLLAATAQFAIADNVKKEAPQGRKPNKEEMQKTVMNILKQELSLDDKQFEAFAPVYQEYRKALNSNNHKAPKTDREIATDSEILAMLNANLDRQIHVATVRKEYIDKFGKVLTARQTAKLYRIDNSMAKRAHDMLNKRDSLHKPCNATVHRGPAPRPQHAPQAR